MPTINNVEGELTPGKRIKSSVDMGARTLTLENINAQNTDVVFNIEEWCIRGLNVMVDVVYYIQHGWLIIKTTESILVGRSNLPRTYYKAYPSTFWDNHDQETYERLIDEEQQRLQEENESEDNESTLADTVTPLASAVEAFNRSTSPNQVEPSTFSNTYNVHPSEPSLSSMNDPINIIARECRAQVTETLTSIPHYHPMFEIPTPNIEEDINANHQTIREYLNGLRERTERAEHAAMSMINNNTETANTAAACSIWEHHSKGGHI